MFTNDLISDSVQNQPRRIEISRIAMNRIIQSLFKRVIISITVLFITRILLDCDWGFSLEAAFFAPFLNDLVDFCFLQWMDFLFPSEAMEVVLALRSDRSWISTMSLLLSRSLPPSDPRAVEDENLRLRQENAELLRRLGEEIERIKAVLDEAERHIQGVQEQDKARQQAWSAYQQELDAEYSRLRALEEENARMRYRLNDLNFKKGKEPLQRFRK